MTIRAESFEVCICIIAVLFIAMMHCEMARIVIPAPFAAHFPYSPDRGNEASNSVIKAAIEVRISVRTIARTKGIRPPTGTLDRFLTNFTGFDLVSPRCFVGTSPRTKFCLNPKTSDGSSEFAAALKTGISAHHDTLAVFFETGARAIQRRFCSPAISRKLDAASPATEFSVMPPRQIMTFVRTELGRLSLSFSPCEFGPAMFARVNRGQAQAARSFKFIPASKTAKSGFPIAFEGSKGNTAMLTFVNSLWWGHDRSYQRLGLSGASNT
jgi:hypothetical protein